jgi:hypothetical protein
MQYVGRSQWPRGLRHELSSLARTLASWVRIPLKAWKSLCVCDVFVSFCLQVAALRRAHPPSKKSYRLCITHSWSWAFPEKLPTAQQLKKINPALYGTRRFITAFTRAPHRSLSWARSIQSIPSHPIALRSISILPTHLRLGFTVVSYLLAFPPIFYPPIRSTCPAHHILFDLNRLCIWLRSWKSGQGPTKGCRAIDR